MIKRACVTCGKPGPTSYCDEHQPKPWGSSTRSSKVKLSGSAQQKRRLRIFNELLFCCHVCGKTGTADELDLDHIVPVGEGGSDEDHNLAPIHKTPCHRDKTLAEAKRARDRRMVTRRYQR